MKLTRRSESVPCYIETRALINIYIPTEGAISPFSPIFLLFLSVSLSLPLPHLSHPCYTVYLALPLQVPLLLVMLKACHYNSCRHREQNCIVECERLYVP